MATADADPSDVRAEYDTVLSDSEITNILGRVADDVARYNDVSSMDTALKRDLEASLAAYRIATRHDRAESSVSSGRTSASYEGSLVDDLRSTVRELDPSNKLPTDDKPKLQFDVF